MSITSKLTRFAGHPIRDFTRLGFTDPQEESASATAAGSDLDRFTMREPCAVRICAEPYAPVSSNCLIPLSISLAFGVSVMLGLAVYDIVQPVVAVGIGLFVGVIAFVCSVSVLDLVEARQREKNASEVRKRDQLTPLSDERQHAVKKLWSSKSYNAHCLARLIHSGNAAKIPALLISNDYQHDFLDLRKCLELAAPHFHSVSALFINELSVDECEISWIENGECGAIASAFPTLEHLQVRGGSTRLAELDAPELKTLILESGGLAADVLRDIANANLPNLTHLEIWVGREDYGSDCTMKDVAQLLSHPFPQLRRLGIRNCEFADDVIEWLIEQPILNQLETLDLSLGCVTDLGGGMLLTCVEVEGLQSLDLHYNFLSDQCAERLQELPLDVDVSDQQEEDYEGDQVYRYCAVGE